VAVRGQRWDDQDGTFRSLRRAVITSEKAEIEAQVLHAETIWTFLLEFCARRKIYRLQVLECVNALMESKAWEEAFSRNSVLESKARELPDDIRAALAQHEAVARSFGPAEMEKLRCQTVPREMQHDQVQKGISAYREADRLHVGMLSESAEEARPVPLFAEDLNRNDVRGTLVAEELREAIEAIVDIDSLPKFENDSVSAFAQLRRGCLHSVPVPETLEQAVKHAPEVLNFLIDFAKQHRIRIKQVCEVLNLLLDCQPWADAFAASPMLTQRVQTELPEELQAAFGLQNQVLMASVSEQARMHAQEAKGPEVIEQARKVAEQLQSLRHSLALNVPGKRPPDTVQARAPVVMAAVAGRRDETRPSKTGVADTRAPLPVAGKGRLPAAVAAVPGRQEDAQPTAAVVRKASRSATDDEWREATTSGGRKYYYNTRTRESCWELPAGAILWPKANPAVFRTGDKIEVFSNSKQAWCPGIVEGVSGDLLGVAFQPPGSKPGDWARKQVTVDSQALRHGSAALSARLQPSNFTEEEKAAYKEAFRESGAPDLQCVGRYLGRSGLERKTLKAIWQVGSGVYGNRSAFGSDEFFVWCRLVAHCQAMQQDATKVQLLAEGGRPLGRLLLAYAVGTPPPRLPSFSAQMTPKPRVR